MYYLEIRFNTKYEIIAKMFIKNIVHSDEIISTFEDDYYICYYLKNKLEDGLLQKLKEYKHFYFLTHYEYK